MKRLRLPNLGCAAALVIVVGGAVSASDQPTQTPIQNGAEKWPIVLAQNALSKQKGTERAKVNVDSKGTILNGYDAVAYFKEGRPVRGSPGTKSTHQDATYLFASSENKADFDKDPLKFAPQYGGFCAYGISLGVVADIGDSPKAFKVGQPEPVEAGTGSTHDLGPVPPLTARVRCPIQCPGRYW
jgi:hypothetical protein